MLKLAGYLAIVGLAAATPSCYPRSDYPWIYVANNDQTYSDAWFMIDLTARTWTDSLAFCDGLGKGITPYRAVTPNAKTWDTTRPMTWNTVKS